ncbi:MAG: tyrosine-type recombinase/integrase [Planctomycetes bacterium]|nr:tyrosine-type recombinase/integrase [Planctomycetota bacterium]
MATLQEREGNYRILFRYQGRQFNFSIGAVESAEAEAKLGQVNLFLLRLSQRLAVIPPGMTIVEYLKFDGRPLAPETPEIKNVKLSSLKAKYLEANREALERTTLDCVRTHFRHFENVLGSSFAISSLTLADLQEYVNKRSKAEGKNGRKLSATTIKKEIQTLRTAWRWAERHGLVAGLLPNDGLRYPRTDEKPPFMTRKEIERLVAVGGLTEAEIADLWHSLYLTVDEVSAFLKHIKQHSLQSFLYPAVCFVAHTGARRSEMLRARVTDVDFAAKRITIHEKKRVQGKNTTRRVPLTPFLEGVLKDWIAEHPGGPFLFCQEDLSRNGTVRPGKSGSGSQLNRGKAYDHFCRALGKGKWKVIAGFHVLRHSFISALANKAVDQRLIDEFVGHQTEAQRRRYRHIYPSVAQNALASVFG